MESVIAIAYVVLAYWANNYLRYHLLNIRAEIYNDIFRHYFAKIFWACFLGCITIPLALIYWLLRTLLGKKD